VESRIDLDSGDLLHEIDERRSCISVAVPAATHNTNPRLIARRIAEFTARTLSAVASCRLITRR